MPPYSKSQSSQSTCSRIGQQCPTMLGQEIHPPDSIQSLQSPTEANSPLAPSQPQPHRVTTTTTTMMSHSADYQNVRPADSDDAPTPFIAIRNSDSSNDNNHNSSQKIQHPLMNCNHRDEPHPNYKTPYQHNCRQEYKQSPYQDSFNNLLQKQQMMHHPQNNTEQDSFPALPYHSHQELSLAERSIKKLVRNSQFFPPRAGEEKWFSRSTVGDGEMTASQPLSECKSEEGASSTVTTHVTTLYEHEIRVEKLLGRGGFCEVRLAHLEDDGSPNNNNSATKEDGDEHEEQPPSAQHQQTYAIKYLSPTISKRKSKKAFSRGAADLAIEARFLSLLSHDNIIRMHHVSAGSFRENYNCLDTREDSEQRCSFHSRSQGCSSSDCMDHSSQGFTFNIHLRHFGYFLVLDYLHETLDHRIKHTYIPEVELVTGENPARHHENHRCITSCASNNSTGCIQQQRSHWLSNLPQWMHHQHVAAFDSKGNNVDPLYPQPGQNLLAKRLIVLRSIAAAVKYLHENHIIFRDLKPDNIGFAEPDNIGFAREEIPKLFDFGLVKELKSSIRVTSLSCHNYHDDDVYKLTGRTGSRRYMSPEVAFSQPYNHKVDIYSFGVLLYEMSTLLQPFDGYTIHRHEVEVLKKGCRPCLVGYNHWPKDLACLIEDCWHGDMKLRPNIDEVITRLDDCIYELAMPVVKEEQPAPRMSARSILSGISQLQLSTRDMMAPPARSNSMDNDQCKGKSKFRTILGVMPTALPSVLRKGTAPQA